MNIEASSRRQAEKKKLSRRRWPRAISRYNLNKARLKSSKKESEEIALYEKERKRKGQVSLKDLFDM